MHQVEFDISAAAIQLEIALPLAVGHVAAPLQYRHQRIDVATPDGLLKCEATLETPVIEVVKE